MHTTPPTEIIDVSHDDAPVFWLDDTPYFVPRVSLMEMHSHDLIWQILAGHFDPSAQDGWQPAPRLPERSLRVLSRYRRYEDCLYMRSPYDDDPCDPKRPWYGNIAVSRLSPPSRREAASPFLWWARWYGPRHTSTMYLRSCPHEHQVREMFRSFYPAFPDQTPVTFRDGLEAV